jgi:hypothetical protein
MRTQSTVLSAFVTISLVVSPSHRTASAQADAAGPPPGVVVALSASVTAYGAGGAGGSASGSHPLTNAEVGGAVLRVVPERCEVGWTNQYGGPAEAGYTGWSIAGRVIAARGDEATVEIEWGRRFDESTSDQESGDWRTTMTLRQDEMIPFDMVRARGDSSLPCQWFVAHVGVSFLDPPEVAGAALRYELWLVHHDRNGRERTDRLDLVGEQGAAVKYAFRPLGVQQDGSLAETTSEETAHIEIGGTVRGRARRDGLVDVTVDTLRSVRTDSGWSGRGGKKQLTVRPGETVEVALPPEYGVFKIHDKVIDLDELFAGQSSIRLTTTRVR